VTYSKGRGLVNYTTQMLEFFKHKTLIALEKNRAHDFNGNVV
jgi:hypothetical protein